MFENILAFMKRLMDRIIIFSFMVNIFFGKGEIKNCPFPWIYCKIVRLPGYIVKENHVVLKFSYSVDTDWVTLATLYISFLLS